MSILTIENMSHSFGDRILFNDVSFRLLKGEHIGLIGANGEGKSTFMKIITDQILPDKGTIEWNNKFSIGYMDQLVDLKEGIDALNFLKEAFANLFNIESKINSLYIDLQNMSEKDMEKSLNKIAIMQEILDKNDFYSINSKIQATAVGLGIKELLDKDVSTLSGGQRTKILLAKLLLQKPDILLLDEPTNHLDEEHIEWLKNYLANYENAFILISHDNAFLNNVVNVVYHLEQKVLTRYEGNYDYFIKLYEIRKEQRLIEYKEQQNEIEKLEDYIRKNKARASTSKQAKSREKKLNKIERIEIKKEIIKPHFNFKTVKMPESIILEVSNLIIGYNRPLSKPLNLKMKRGQKIAVTGANGLGKTTLLKTLLGMLKPINGEITLSEHRKIGYFEQEIAWNSTNSVLYDVWSEFPHLTQTEVRRELARCGLTRQHIDSPINILSGGEQAKVRLCKLINEYTNVLVLDEPTNHLDINAKNELKRALKEYEGSMILVCHEPEFYKDIATDIWDCEEWGSFSI
ncbi:ABC-F family ATP-binding cassette domain-containing protein [Clostridium beijerinckii]|jgi:ATPase components of ABC transporters with duplicated ATPase domains|uniref:ABC-F family ATP-binding cassette domain-containing protein n=2 Tax=Clostridium beijerinckii TaxID=1520 RepID=A0AAE2RRF6_CLOBE|nr:ABC-F family ATP-binding cassette domain-containing protein [Clostridium beijerinckii]ABR35187.1 ABC transporter related [Clostridium beijerinckii NCIMB 8052]AIU01617.1 ABC transporter related protein [Clostridium beijerinckii ATCC 35702]MBF7810178.1 ABC-F family ATP-binding cassette domain-containing protein [Clostridium beijerinckii]NOW90817.1 ATPase subunit of ABC transporter with duplicated ATPase domains [Clostridium beijerinckii]NRT23419.1 ATPase subunit of ABC transporter with duplic